MDVTADVSFETYAGSTLIRRGCERLIQLVVECATDINCMILKGLEKPAPKDYFNSFIELGEAGVLDMELELRIAPSTGLLHILVHEYQKIDDRIVYHSLASVRTQYAAYIEKVAAWVGAEIINMTDSCHRVNPHASFNDPRPPEPPLPAA